MNISPEPIAVEIPTEPPAKSVVIDRIGDAWQRHPAFDRWVHVMTFQPLIRITESAPGSLWRHLVVDHGPLTVVHVPSDAS